MISNIFSNVKNMLGSSKNYNINEYHVVEEELISEGGYAFVYRVSDVKDKQSKFALKKMILQVKSRVYLFRIISKWKQCSRK